MPAWLRLLRGPVPVLVLCAGAGVAGAVRGGFTDLSVYLYAGRAVLHGLPVYESVDPVTGLHFTYPPFAAILMVPLTPLPTWLVAAVWTGASVGAIAAVVLLVSRELGCSAARATHREAASLVVARRGRTPRLLLPGTVARDARRPRLKRPAPGWQVALISGGALALEPVWQNLAFGQANLFMMVAVLVDLLRPARRWSGVLVGIAAGVKLTPLVLVVLLVLVGRRAAAGRAAVVFAGTVAVGFLVTPGSAATYWADGLVDAGRVGPPALAHNQSVYGALARLLGGPPPTWAWLAVAGPLSVAVLLVGALWWRRGERVLGTCLGALAMLFASPISWSHHWVWAVPVALALWARSRWASAAWTAVFVARPIVWPPYGQGREYGWSPTDHVVGNAYLLAALTVSVWAATTLDHRASAARLRAPSRRLLSTDGPSNHPPVG